MGLRTRLRPLPHRLRSAATRPFRTAWSWWKALDPAERILYRAGVLLAIGCGMVAIPLGLIVPGVLLALVFFGFNLRRT
jgi:hypothetical protein